MGTLVKEVEITIDGNEYKNYNFSNYSLSQNLLSPNVLSFTMQKKEFDGTSIADSKFPVPKDLMGAKVVLSLTTMRFDAEQKKILSFEGFIYNINISHRSDMYAEQLFDVQAVSYDYLLSDHPHCFSYEEMNLKDIVTKTLDPYKITNEINPRTTAAIPYTVQYNETNYQFLTRLAQRYGEWMYHDGVKWIFGKMKKRETIELDPRYDIQSYSFKSALAHHKLKHAHHNYLKYENPVKADAAISELTKSGYHTLTDKAIEKSTELFTKETFQHLQCSNPEVNDLDELEVSLKAQLLGEKATQVVCIGSTLRADLTIGSNIKIADHLFQTEKKHSDIDHDNLIITSISHSFEDTGNYSNSFTAYPASSEYPPYFNSDNFPVSGSQRAKVMDNKDPEKMGRIRVQFLWQQEQDPAMMTPWIRIAQPYGGDDKGFYFIPEIDEEVMVDFENSNAEKPYVVGTLWHGKQKPHKGWVKDNHTGTNDIKGILTRNSHGLIFVDYHDGKGGIRMFDDYGNIIEINSDDNIIHIESQGDLILKAGKNIIMEAGENRVSTIAKVDDVTSDTHNYEAANEIYMGAKKIFAYGKDETVLYSDSLVQMQSESTANVLGEGSVFVSSGADTEVAAGTSMKINAQASMDVNAQANMTIKGAMVKIN